MLFALANNSRIKFKIPVYKNYNYYQYNTSYQINPFDGLRS